MKLKDGITGFFKKITPSKVAVVVYWLLFILMLGMFFTNDFGLVDIHKTSIITAVAVDSVGEEVQVTAEIAVPQPSQSGENIKYTQVQGSGLTIADALNEINSKTGFNPKLQFCKIILIGDTCREKPLFRLLGCFYRKNYSELTTVVAMCKGNAFDMLSQKSAVSDRTSEAIVNVLSDEIEKSANTASANLKDIALSGFSKSAACYMPYVEINEPGTSQEGGNGDNVGGDAPQGGSQSGGSGGSQGGGESGQSGGSAQSGGSGESQPPVEFTARKTAIFSNGEFKGILDEQQSFALSVLKNEIRLAVLPCDADDVHYTLGLSNVNGGFGLSVKDGVPELNINFKAKARIQGARVVLDPDRVVYDDNVSQNILDAAQEALKSRIGDLWETCVTTGSDILGIRELLYKYNYKYYDAFKDDILSRVRVNYNMQIESVG